MNFLAIRSRCTVRKSKQSGFTLIELLVVIAIIAVLASLLLGAVSTAKASAKSAHCKSNLRQISLALSLYLTDNGQYPLVHDFAGSEFWFDWLAPFLGPQSVTREGPMRHIKFGGPLVCPTHQPKSGSLSFNPSYGYNAYGAGGPGLGGGMGQPAALGEWPLMVAVKESDVRVPSNLIAFGDGYMALKSASSASGLSYKDSGGLLMQSEVVGRGSRIESDFLPDLIKPSEAAKRHRKRLNMAFCDGHVESDTIQTWFYIKNDATMRRWNLDNEAHPEYWSLLP